MMEKKIKHIGSLFVTLLALALLLGACQQASPTSAPQPTATSSIVPSPTNTPTILPTPTSTAKPVP
ncbi:MAG: hypothetical protein WBW48_23380, partial [Anaerolineae bacterium]